MKPVVKDVVSRICRSAVNPELEQPKFRSGKLVLVLGVRGGVGATTVAAHTAWHLSESGRRVVLLDLDVDHGDASLLFDTLANTALSEAVEFPERVDKLFLERAVERIGDRLHLLASLNPLIQNRQIEAGTVAPLLEKLAAQYRYVVVDLPRHLAAEVIHATLLPRTCLLVSSATLSSARDVRRWRQQIGANVMDRSTMHVLNHHEPHGGLAEREFVRAAGQAPDISIPYFRDLAEATMLGIKESSKCAGFRRAIQQIIRPLTGDQAETAVPFYRKLWG